MTARPSENEFTFKLPIRVRWAEVDGQGIVFSAHYVMYFDLAMTEYMREIGYPYPAALKDQGTDSFIVNANVNYRSSAQYDDDLIIGARVSKIGRTSLIFSFAIFRKSELLAEGTLTYVNASLQDKAPTPWPRPFVDRILSYEATPPLRA